jgi:hypothetical protein
MMDGFSEQGQPGEWDMAIGTVKGYRWWILTVPFESAAPPHTRASFDRYRYGLGLGIDELPPSMLNEMTGYEKWLPNMRKAQVTGMHAYPWSYRDTDDDGWYQASCAQLGSYSTNPITGNTVRLVDAGHGEVPDSKCGCGFWAYWHGLVADWDACRPYVVSASRHRINVMVPVGGVVEGSGRTIIGERGFRAEKVRITDLAFNIKGTNAVFQDDSGTGDFLHYGSGNSWVNPAIVPAWSAVTIPSPCEVGAFLPYLEYRTELRSEVLMRVFDTALNNALGSGFRWHGDIYRLRETCHPDENYGNGKRPL